MKRISLQKTQPKSPTDEKLHTQPKAMNQPEAFTKFRMNSLVSLNKTYEFSEFTDPMDRNWRTALTFCVGEGILYLPPTKEEWSYIYSFRKERNVTASPARRESWIPQVGAYSKNNPLLRCNYLHNKAPADDFLFLFLSIFFIKRWGQFEGNFFHLVSYILQIH